MVQDKDFEFLVKLIKDKSGIILTKDKGYLIENRLFPIARKWNLDSIESLVASLRLNVNPALVDEVIDAMTTNETFFFRDTKPFDNLKDVILPEILANRPEGSKIRIWCAAASCGQEPYSIAMILKEQPNIFNKYSFEIIGTDISRKILDKAKTGIYTQFEVQRGLPIQMLVKYFEKYEDRWKIKQDLKSMIEFKHFNLLNNPSILGKFDIIFCRNVLIYFDPPTKQTIFGYLSKSLQDDGALFLGGAETVHGFTDKFGTVDGIKGVYKPQVAQAESFNRLSAS